MERYNLAELKKGEELSVKTESGSLYKFFADREPALVNESTLILRGVRATRVSDHQLEGRPEAIDSEPAVLIVHRRGEGSEISTGDWMEIVWDRHHPANAEDWDIQFGPKFQTIRTTDVADILHTPAVEQ